MARTLEALLKLTFDKKAVSDAKTGLALVKKELDRLEKDASATRRALNEALDQGKDAKRLRDDLKLIEKAMDDVRRNAQKGLGEAMFKQTADRMAVLQERAEKLGAASAQIGVVGGLAFGGLLLSANKYVQTAGMASEVSQRWLAATDQMDQAQTRLGQTVATALLPFLEKSADLMERASDFAEANPGAVKAALAIAGGGVAVGAIGTLVSQGIKLYADVKYLAAAALQNKAANTMLAAAGIQARSAGAGLLGGAKGLLAKGAAAVGGTAGLAAAGTGAAVVGGGAVLGGGIYEAIRPESSGSLGQFASVAAGGYGMLAGMALGDEDPTQRSTQWLAQVAYWLGEIDETARDAAYGIEQADGALGETGGGDGGGQIISQQAVDSFIAFQQQVTAAEEQYNDQRQQIVEQYGERRSQAEERYEQQRADVVENYEQRKAEDEEDFQRKRGRQLRDFLDNNIEMWGQFNDQVQDLTEQTARAQAQANQRYEQQVQQVIQDAARAQQEATQRYQQQVQQVIQDAARAQAQAESRYYEQRREAVQDYNKDVQRAEEDHLRQMERMREDHNMSLEDAARSNSAIAFLREQRSYETNRSRAEEDHQVEMSRRSADFADRLRQMEQQYQAEKEKRDEERQRRLEEMEQQQEEERQRREEEKQRRLEEMEQQHEEDKAQREEERQRRLEEMQAEFEERRAERRADFQQQLADEDEDRAIRNQRAEAQFQEQLAKLDEQHAQEQEQLEAAKDEQLESLDEHYNEEKQKRETAFADQLRQTDSHLLNEYNTRQRYYTRMTSQLQSWLSSMQGRVGSNLPGYGGGGGGRPASRPNNPTFLVPGRQSGGYVGAGLYNLHDGEFVLSPSTTRRMEDILGPLSQDKFTQAMNKSMVYSPTYNISEREDAQAIMHMVDRHVNAKLVQIERSF